MTKYVIVSRIQEAHYFHPIHGGFRYGVLNAKYYDSLTEANLDIVEYELDADVEPVVV